MCPPPSPFPPFSPDCKSLNWLTLHEQPAPINHNQSPSVRALKACNATQRAPFAACGSGRSVRLQCRAVFLTLNAKSCQRRRSAAWFKWIALQRDGCERRPITVDVFPHHVASFRSISASPYRQEHHPADSSWLVKCSAAVTVCMCVCVLSLYRWRPGGHAQVHL